MFSLNDSLEFLISGIPTPELLSFNSQRDKQDFNERDFDRRLEILKVETLISIANSLKELSLDTRGITL